MENIKQNGGTMRKKVKVIEDMLVNLKGNEQYSLIETMLYLAYTTGKGDAITELKKKFKEEAK